MLTLRLICYMFLMDHIIVDPVTGKHYFTWRRR